MDTINISKETFEKLEKKILPTYVPHGEGNMYLINVDGRKMIFKRFIRTAGLYFSNKLYVIHSLMDNKDIIQMPELVLPEALVTINYKASGIIMPYIDGENLSSELFSSSESIEKKIELLKKIGEILEKMDALRKRTKLGLYLNDLHESNFVATKNELYTVDLDSASILESAPFGTKYLSCFTPLKNFPDKYNSNMSLTVGGEFEPSYDTELYCYYMIVLNFLYNGRVHQMNEEEFNDYLDYLVANGADSKFIEMCSKVYSNEPNVNPKDYLDSLSSVCVLGDMRTYKRIRGK